ncbi:MAG: EamA-like transporter family [Chloroflexi bacterium]|jgi:drug/metabolite transporter (DMT)-like permease|nr:EamA-like transporter family [Chloroflexota bacterium]
MRLKDTAALLFLAAIWGSSFLFIRIAAPVLGPLVLMTLRVVIAGAALLLYAFATGTDLAIKTHWRQYLIIGLINSAIPFTLIGAAELNLTAGYAAILNATSPLFGAIVSAIWIHEELALKKLIGLVLGLVGVAVVVGLNPLSLSGLIILSIGASIAAAAFYGFSSVYVKVFGKGIRPLALATGSQLGAAVWLLPLAPFAWPDRAPDLTTVLAVLAIALLATALGYLIFFGLIERVGPTKTLTVTFLAPVFGIIWGVIFLNEVLTLSTVVGFAIILSGTAFVTGFSLKRMK